MMPCITVVHRQFHDLELTPLSKWCFFCIAISLYDLNDDLLAPNPQVAGRIIHAHASGFGKGNLGDLAPNAQRGEFFLNWFKHIDRAYTIAKLNGLNPSGYVSLELELPERTNIVQGAIDQMGKWLNDKQL